MATNTGINSDSQDMGSKIGTPIIYNTPAPTSFASGNQTYTAANLLGQIIVHDGTGGSTATLSTAALLVSAIPNCRVGDTVECLIINGANVSGTITLAAGTGGTFDTNQGGGSKVITFGNSKYINIRITNSIVGSEAYVIYS